MATIAYPALANIRPHAYSFRLVGNTFVHESQHTGTVRTTTVPGAKWRFTCEYRALSPDQYGLIMAFVAQLEGQGGRFFAFPLHRDWPLGTCRATSATAGAASTLATTVAASGLGANATLLPGDFFALAGYLYTVTAPLTANGSGAGTIQFKPGLRVANSAGAPLAFYRPSSTFRLVADDVGVIFQPGNIANYSMDAVEAWV